MGWLSKEEGQNASGSPCHHLPLAEMRGGPLDLSLGDTFVLQLARKPEGKVLTGDSDPRGINKAEFLQ